jgi:hypothetical protein
MGKVVQSLFLGKKYHSFNKEAKCLLLEHMAGKYFVEDAY